MQGEVRFPQLFARIFRLSQLAASIPVSFTFIPASYPPSPHFRPSSLPLLPLRSTRTSVDHTADMVGPWAISGEFSQPSFFHPTSSHHDEFCMARAATASACLTSAPNGALPLSYADASFILLYIVIGNVTVSLGEDQRCAAVGRPKADDKGSSRLKPLKATMAVNHSVDESQEFRLKGTLSAASFLRVCWREGGGGWEETGGRRDGAKD